MIRDYAMHDADAVVEVWRKASDAAHHFLKKSFLNNEADNLKNIYLVHAQTRVFVQDGAVGGFIFMVEDEIGGLFLDPILHGQGHGRTLLGDAAKDRGDLTVQVFERNRIGRRFYHLSGFQEINRSQHEPTGEIVLHLRRRAAT